MDTVTTQASSSASVFHARVNDPQHGVALAVADVAKLLNKYLASRDPADRMTLLTEVEALRRYVLVPGALLQTLRRPTADGSSLGRDLCTALRGMVDELPAQGKTTSLQGARNLERDTRRAVASLAFVASLDPSFV